jgi:hypothetical protein
MNIPLRATYGIAVAYATYAPVPHLSILYMGIYGYVP